MISMPKITELRYREIQRMVMASEKINMVPQINSINIETRTMMSNAGEISFVSRKYRENCKIRITMTDAANGALAFARPGLSGQKC